MEKALISKVQSYSTKDGPGLRTTVFFMGCNLRCLWCANPENLKSQKRVFYFKDRCKKCGLCVNHAHNQSITFDSVGCKINRKKCNNLLEMADICPYNAYEIIGKEMTSDELFQKLMRDQPFYQVGQGGVTFSGGEAALQADFIEEISKLLQKNKIHVCLDTAGLISSHKLMRMLKHIDMVLYDLKAIDNDIHKKCTGVSNTLILDNAKLIAQSKIPMIIRLVIVPQYNDDLIDMKRRIDFICSLGSSVKQVDILKYHIYGIGKYDKLGETYLVKQPLKGDDKKINDLYYYAVQKGLNVTVEG